MPEMNPSVGVFVVLYKAALMGVRVYVPLPIVAVFVLVLDVLVLMLDVCVRMRHVPVGVLVSMLRGHSAPLLAVRVYSSRSANVRIDRASLTEATRFARIPANIFCRAIRMHLACK
jgi:hypothetical protein